MSEAANLFVSSRGLLKSCDIFSSTPYTNNKYLTNYPDTRHITSIKIPTIYICGSAIPEFRKRSLPKINFKFILVSGDCDKTIPNDIMTEFEFNDFINNENLVHWFCQNIVRQHNKITIIPIGLDYHTMTSMTSCIAQEKILLSITKKAKLCYYRQIKCYANFHFSMTPSYENDRQNAYNNINKDLVFYEPKNIPRLDTWNNQKEYAFAICPNNNSLDCHIIWEALVIGCIPIIKTSLINHLFVGLPVLIVNNWEDITLVLLQNTIVNFKEKYNNNKLLYKKLTLQHWIDKFNKYKIPLT